MENLTNDLFLRENKQLYFRLSDGETREVRIIPCFPRSHPSKYLSIRDDKNRELKLIKSLDDLERKQRELVTTILKWNQFSHEISKVYSIEEDFELRVWLVETQSGSRTFQTQLEDWPIVESDGRIFIGDLSGDTYSISNWDKLDAKSKKILNPLIE
jgi:hypothetical protein